MGRTSKKRDKIQVYMKWSQTSMILCWLNEGRNMKVNMKIVSNLEDLFQIKEI